MHSVKPLKGNYFALASTATDQELQWVTVRTDFVDHFISGDDEIDMGNIK